MQIISIIFVILTLIALVWLFVGPVIALFKIITKKKMNNKELVFYFSGVFWLVVLFLLYFFINIVLGFLGLNLPENTIPTLSTIQ